MSTALEHFEGVRASSGCTFALSSRLEGVDEWDPEASVEANVENYIPAIESLCASDKAEPLDGLVMEAPGSLGGTVDDLADFVGQVVYSMVAKDPAEDRCLDSPVERPGWWLTFAGVELFILTFAPCYPEAHPRWSGGLDSVFLLIQPRSAFTRKRRPGTKTLGQTVRRAIRKRFAMRGVFYDVPLAESPIEAYQFVKPIRVGEPPVRWWEPDRTKAEVDA